MKARRIVALFLSLAMVLSLVACSGGSDKPKTEVSTPAATGENAIAGDGNEFLVSGDYPEIPAGEIIDVPQNLTDEQKQEIIAKHTDAEGRTFVTMALVDDPGSMCPYGSGASKPRNVVLPLVYDKLFNIDVADGTLEPCVGKSFQYLGDKVWELVIEEGVVDSAGNPIKAEDVKFSLWDVAVGVHNTSSIKSYCESIDVVDEYTLHIKMALEGDTCFRGRILQNYVFSKASYEASPDGMITTPVGSGPYVMAGWTSGSEMVFVKNENYWDKDINYAAQMANVDKVVCKVIKDGAQRVIALEAGEIDFLSAIDEADLGNFAGEGYFTSYAYAAQRQTLFFNASEKGHISDVRVRQAICYAMNNEDIMVGASGSGRLCYSTSYYVAPNYNKEWETEDYYNYNPEKALDLLAEAGVNPSDLTVVIMTENYPEVNVRMAEIIQAQLGEIGITVELKPVDGALFSEYKFDPTSSDIIIASCGGSADNVLGGFTAGDYATTSETSGLMHVVDEEWADIQEKAMASEMFGEYVDICHDYLTENVYGYSIYHQPLFCVTSSVVTGYGIPANSYDVPGANTYLWNE